MFFLIKINHLYRNHTKECLKSVREDVKRGLNPTPYKVGLILILLLKPLKKSNEKDLFQLIISD